MHCYIHWNCYNVFFTAFETFWYDYVQFSFDAISHSLKKIADVTLLSKTQVEKESYALIWLCHFFPTNSTRFPTSFGCVTQQHPLSIEHTVVRCNNISCNFTLQSRNVSSKLGICVWFLVRAIFFLIWNDISFPSLTLYLIVDHFNESQ